MTGFAVWSGTCPHCGRENTSFDSVAQALVESVAAGKGTRWNVFFMCNACKGGLVVDIISTEGFGPHGLNENLLVPGTHYVSHQTVEFFVIDTHPKPPAHLAPDHVPERIAAAYIEASENLHRKRHETSQMLSRKALDLATKRLLPESQKWLKGRIDELRDAGKITPEMGEWAHIVRDDGNISVHDENEVTREEAAELLAFTETFLMYAFTLPGMIAKRRQPADESEQAAVDS
ncbi:DUF4145 domain-containing protein [Parapusillimonas sp. JC17]|uniref:DUF4145 domain-containing protein n=1 Tax=Parapusillimonas sp. JC17 TaxID=3445768 RepID=UPI003FA03E0F